MLPTMASRTPSYRPLCIVMSCRSSSISHFIAWRWPLSAAAIRGGEKPQNASLVAMEVAPNCTNVRAILMRLAWQAQPTGAPTCTSPRVHGSSQSHSTICALPRSVAHSRAVTPRPGTRRLSGSQCFGRHAKACLASTTSGKNPQLSRNCSSVGSSARDAKSRSFSAGNLDGCRAKDRRERPEKSLSRRTEPMPLMSWRSGMA
mmetsp:Transcript_81996/g.235559  ORF Transcript_81996/g.235559 Transcript_81996/m.235559 type:complete len:203 (-) Transcript_81996:30-638(-)